LPSSPAILPLAGDIDAEYAIIDSSVVNMKEA